MRLTDRFGRRIEYLRLSVTDRCDLRCAYCMPGDFSGYEEPEHWLNFDEIERLVGLFARFGLRRVRLTGGEPLMRNGLASLARRIKAIPGVDDLSLSTNGTQLRKHGRTLRDAGVNRLNVSLDTLQPARFTEITRRDALDDVLAGLATARAIGFAPIKINMVWLAGVNDDELEAMVDFCRQGKFILRLIETMPMGETGRQSQYASLQPLIAALKTRFGLIDGLIPGGGPARYLVSPDGQFSLGFITPLSQHFCATCNRVRLTVDGMLHLCLGQEDRLDLRSLIRSGASDDRLLAEIQAAIDRKPERHEFSERPEKIIRVMSSTGG
ncbi:MAG: GTP 3',8-cyclase MoaA [Betaproteobacteria bacterium HGW-Betaproteobacteria-6]|jgi:cyclic pyranopterin phosphate synthase|nr:MAG: GTP 3',8-cyclase MoaA [Betaproteobacteria bacterium HGW-Betaproteobacteria-6]